MGTKLTRNIKEIFEKKVFDFLDYPMTILSVYACTYFIYQDFGVRQVLGYAVLSLLLIGIVLKNFSNFSIENLNIFHYTYLFMLIVILLNFIRPDAYHDKESFSYIVIMIITFGFFVFSKINLIDVKKSLSVFLGTSVVFSIIILFFQVFKDLYWSLIYPLLSVTAQELAKRYFFKGYSISFGGVAYTSYIIVFGLIILLSYLIYNDLHAKSKLRLYSIMALLTLTLILLGRRGELLAFLVALIVYYIFRARQGSRLKRASIVVSTIIGIIILIIICLPFLLKIKFLHRYTMTLNALVNGTNMTGGVTSGRIELYNKAYSLFKENLVFGVGWGSFAKHGYLVLGKPAGTTRNVHNIVLQLLAETGLVGFLGIMSPLLFSYYKTSYLLSEINTNESKDYSISVLKILISVSLLLQSFILFASLIDPINFKNIFWILYVILSMINSYVFSNINSTKNLKSKYFA
ncbi:O-antigen ligase domain-containing protein [Erysipelothrix piscisicarius]|uniref:O-antigen ligase domain-containing protein n=1 Tax=Erysipelothrix piscisicarius TaxID=2485784 RepID=A0A3Q8S6D0_9FIRM|nr:O-antigen ligase family protein [Erysipelothrix piscisicarius]AZK43434.1 O-antigen ligase domain-containing protein [Erysipelothrix piscisicarius]